MRYDAQGNVAGATDPLSRTASARYNTFGGRTSLTDALNNTTTYGYDLIGRNTSTTLPDQSTTSQQYDGNGNVTVRTDAQGRQTMYTYDPADRLIKTVYPDGTSTSTTYYTWRGQAVTQTDQAGHMTQNQYDLAGQLIATTMAYGTADAATTQFTYDAGGRRIRTRDPRGFVSTSVYDDAGRVVESINALNQSTKVTYDAAGRQTAVTDAAGEITQYTYDARGRVTQVSYPDGTTTSSTYDGTGHVIASTDQAQAVTQYSFDAAGQMTSTTDALGQVTRYGYDADGNLLTRADANNHVTTFTYDTLNRVKTRTLPGGGGVETMNYNLTGTVASIRDFNGKTTNFAYDVLNRLVTRTPDVSFGELAVSFLYTLTGQRQSMTDASGTTSYGYDNQNRVVTKTTPVGKLTYTYDASGNQLTVTSSNAGGTSVGYSYDGLNRLSTVSDHGQTQATYTYDVVGNLGGMVLGNGVPLQPQYDAMYRLTALTMQATQFSKIYSYSYGPVGNRLSSSDSNGRQVNYGYDSIYRLTQEAITTSGGGMNGASTYNLDAVGNRLTRLSNLPGIGAQTPTYDANDRTVGNSYDANGNTLTAGGRTFGYDSFDRLTKFNGGSVGMVYDGDGTRVAKTSGGVTTQYLVDDLNPTRLTQVAEEVVGGVVQRRYVYGLQRVSETQANTTSYYGYDGHGDVRFLMNAAGAVTDTYDYDAFGNLISGTGTTANVYRYQGEALDSETGLYYLRARYYDPGTGRFLSVDPLADQGEHPYSYAGADPVNGHDPTGQAEIIEDALTTWAAPVQAIPLHSQKSCWGSIILSTDTSPAQLMDTCQFSRQNGSGQPSNPPKKCCECALKTCLKNFLEAQDQALLRWDPSLVDDLVSAGRDAKKEGIDPRLMAAIATLESGHGTKFNFSSNNPFGLGPGNTYKTQLGGITAESNTLATHIYDWNQPAVALLYAGHDYIWKDPTSRRHWPQDVKEYPSYCSHADCSPKPVSDFLSTMPGDKANDLEPGNPNKLNYPCAK